MNTAEMLINQGIEKGDRDRQIEIARKMKAKGYQIADIADVTGLSPEEIEKLSEP